MLFICLCHSLNFFHWYISHFFIFPLLSPNDIFSINVMTIVLKIIGLCDMNIKIIRWVLKVLTYIITIITAGPIGFAVILGDNVCLNLQNCQYSISIYHFPRHDIPNIFTLLQTRHILTNMVAANLIWPLYILMFVDDVICPLNLHVLYFKKNVCRPCYLSIKSSCIVFLLRNLLLFVNHVFALCPFYNVY